MNLYLVRHGQDDETVRGGWCTNELLEEGKQQSHLLDEKLKHIHFNQIYSSDLIRAKETAEIISNYLEGNSDIHFSSDLREINNGFLSGMKHNLAEKKYPGLYYRTLDFNEKYPGGESPKEFYERVKFFLEEEIKRISHENVLIITHGGVISILYHLLNDTLYE